MIRQSSDAGIVIEGFSGNNVTQGANGGTISVGGQISFPNLVTLEFDVVAGGIVDLAGNYSIVIGGKSNSAEGIREPKYRAHLHHQWRYAQPFYPTKLRTTRGDIMTALQA